MDPTLHQKIRQFYDASTPLWERVWGEHMHHGYYGPDGREPKDHYQAQIDLIEAVLSWGDVTRAGRIVDVGCGVGGSALYLAEKFSARVTGMTLSPVQARRARERAAAAGLNGCAHFQVADALAPPYKAAAFDLVLALESGEHMPNKRRFVQACVDLLMPGGQFLLVAWCHRPVPPALSRRELRFLRRLYRLYHLPYLISIGEFADLAHKAGLEQVRTADWTEAVRPFWKAVILSALRFRSLKGLLDAGWPTFKGAYAMQYMLRGYRSGLIRFGMLQGVKP